MTLARRLFAALLVVSSLALHASAQEGAPVLQSDEEKKAAQAELQAKFEGYVDEFPNLAEVKGDLKGSPVTYAIHLKHAKEPALSPPKLKLRGKDFVVRLIILEPGGKKTSIARLNKTWGGIELIGKTLDITKILAGEKKGDYVLNDIIVVRESDFDTVEHLIKKLDFFKMQTASNEVPQDSPLMMLEVVTDSEHKIVERYLTDKNKEDDFFQLCRKVGKLSKMKLGVLTAD